MAPMEVIAIMSPQPGKADRVQELLRNMAVHVEKQEPGTLTYHLIRENPSKANPDSPSIVVVEKYRDVAAIREHGASAPFKALGKTMQAEGLLKEPMKLVIGTGIGGFVSRDSKL